MSTTRRPTRRRRSEASPARAAAADRRIRGDFSEISFKITTTELPPNASLPRRFCSSVRGSLAPFSCFFFGSSETKDILCLCFT